MEYTQSDINRFYQKIDKNGDCWEWTASKREGYGAFKLNGRVRGAHRIMWLFENNEWYNSKDICHHCDNRSCVNPNHLFVGTRSDNMKDAYEKGKLNIVEYGKKTRFKKGRKSPRRSLSDNKVKKIKNEIQNKTLKEVSTKFDVSLSIIKDISSGRTYKDI